jgi:hypothetical protein
LPGDHLSSSKSFFDYRFPKLRRPRARRRAVIRSTS